MHESNTIAGVSADGPTSGNRVVDHANFYRTRIKAIASGVKWLAEQLKAGNLEALGAPATDDREAIPPDKGEMVANAMLAYRHLEDASQRLGKVIQAADGGISVYDKKTTVGARE